MRLKALGFRLLAISLGTLLPSLARGQYGYPSGYGGYGWGGFSAASGRGQEAAGMGYMAAGAGSYNLQTAQARNINVNTNMQLNEYMYESIQQDVQRRYAQKSAEIKDYGAAVAATEDRLRNHPTQEDIYNGDALNCALMELTDPRYSAHVWSAASSIKIPGKLIEVLPFNDAADAVTGCISKLTSAEPPKIMQRPEFRSDIDAYRKVSAELRKEADKDGDVKSATVKQFRKVLQAAADKLKALSDVDQIQKNEVEMHIKALLGLSYMLDGPSLDIYLAGVGDLKQVSFDRLLSFMRSFNLRFGPAKDPNQKEALDTMYRILVQLRSDMFGEGTGTLVSQAPPPKQNDKRAQNFYSGMHLDELHPDFNRTPPPPPAPVKP